MTEQERDALSKDELEDEPQASQMLRASVEEEDEPDRDEAKADELATRAHPWLSRLRMLNWAGWIIALALGLLFGALFLGGAPTAPSSHKHSPAQSPSAQAPQQWTCSMHPEIKSPEPGQCPICGMDLIPASGANELGPDQVRLGERARALLRLRVEEVRLGDEGEQPARWLLSRLVTDESQERTITAWTGGRIERLRVSTTGERVSRGQVVMEIYSPELYAAHRDLLAAQSQLKRHEASGAEPFILGPARATLEAIEQRLRLLGVSDAELVQLRKSEKPWTRVPQRAPFSGTVIQRIVESGQYVQPGSPLLKIADLSEVWAELDAYESDLALLAKGQQVELTLQAFPGELFTGKIAFIDPVVDVRTRTAKVRVELENREGKLKPGMYGQARVMRAPSDTPPLLIPQTAPLFSGKRSLVYVELASAQGPVYEAREVALGAKLGSFYPVISGLKRGERVVTHGAFVLDADLQLRSGLSLMRRPDDLAERQGDDEAPVVGASVAFMDGLKPIFSGYLDVQEALADSKLELAQSKSLKLVASIKALDPQDGELAALAWRQIRAGLLRDAQQLSQSPDLEQSRAQFKFVTERMKTLLARFGNPLDDKLSLAYCPMAFDNQGAEWLQREVAVNNVYFGDAMRGCGEIRKTLDGGERLLSDRGPR